MTKENKNNSVNQSVDKERMGVNPTLQAPGDPPEVPVGNRHITGDWTKSDNFKERTKARELQLIRQKEGDTNEPGYKKTEKSGFYNMAKRFVGFLYLIPQKQRDDIYDRNRDLFEAKMNLLDNRVKVVAYGPDCERKKDLEIRLEKIVDISSSEKANKDGCLRTRLAKDENEG